MPVRTDIEFKENDEKEVFVDNNTGAIILYVDGYNTIEDSPDGKIRKESLEEQQELISSEQGRLETIDGQIKSIISSVSHIVSVVSPDAEPIEQNHTIMSTFLTELDGKIEAYEELHAHDMDRIDELIDNVHSVINIHTGTNVSIAPYRDIYTYEGVQLINLLSKLDEGDATVIAAADRVNSLYEEYCTDRTSRERKENGAAKVVEGSLIFLAGAVTAVFLSRTAGAVTMYEGATIVVGAFSYIAITHGLSNVAEGVQEYRFGCSRDTESVAVNNVRDYVYFGNEKVYNGVTNLGATGCSVYLTGMGGYMYAQTYGIPIWQGELIQGGIALTSAGADRFVRNQVSTMDVDPWTKNLAGPVTGLFAGSVGNAAVTRYGIPAIKQANTIGNVGSSRSITEIATQNTAGNTSYGKPSERIGDFTDLYGTTVDDILDRIPDDAILREISQLKVAVLKDLSSNGYLMVKHIVLEFIMKIQAHR